MLHRHYQHGDYLFICDRCGFIFLGSKGKLEWDNLFVCFRCFEERHPQDYIRGIPDHPHVPIARPQQQDVFVETNEVLPENL